MPGASGRHATSRRLSGDARRLSGDGSRRKGIRLWQIALGVLLGNLLLHQLPVLPARPVLLAISILALIAWRWSRLATIVLLAFCWTGLVAQNGLAARWPAESDGQDVALLGWVDELPRHDAGRTLFSLRVVETATEVPLRRVRLSWYDPAPALVAGAALELEARLRSPRGLVNPGGFDYERWLFLEHYDATGYVRDGRIDSSRRFGLNQFWLTFRANLVARLGRLIEDSDAAALVQALALGERGGFEDRHWSVLQRTGTSHLVAVSGLHIGMIGALSYLFALRLALFMPYSVARRAHSLAAGISIVPAAIYAALAGFTLPTRRALIMLLVIQALIIARRRWPLGSGLGLALILVLSFDPLASLTASFWLSFGAVALLLAVSSGIERPLAERHSRALTQVIGFCRLQLALTLGLAPLVIWYFGQFSLASLFVNLIAIPAFGLIVVPLSLIAAIAAATGSDGFGVPALSGAVAEMAWHSLEFVASGRFAAFELSRPPLSVFLLGIAAIAMSLTGHRLPGRRLALLGLVPLALDHREAPAPGFATATILDVGHGLAVAIETAEHRVLYDAGPSYRSGFDAGAEIVAPALGALSGRPLDLLILSHGDSDHAGGAAAIVERYPDTRVMAGPDVDQLSPEPCVAGQSWSWDQVRFSVLHPPAGFGSIGNESSCVILMETQSGKMLLTGDIEMRAESALAGEERLAADIVIVPHHGSLTSSTVGFVAGVDPRVAIVSAGHNNRWNFPRPEVQRRWEDIGALLFVTGNHGAINVLFRADGIELSVLGNSRRRYWQANREPVSGAIDVSAL